MEAAQRRDARGRRPPVPPRHRGPRRSERWRRRRELGRLAVAKAREWTDRQAAAALLLLAIDAFLYPEQGKPSLGVSTGETVAETPAPYDAPATKPAPAPALSGTAPLQDVLRAVADEALGFLKDGHHVLLAGAPGTGKTTVAQWVAHSWNAGADRVTVEAVAVLLAPTTVASSAWSPFHTIGGLVATTKGARGVPSASGSPAARPSPPAKS